MLEEIVNRVLIFFTHYVTWLLSIIYLSTFTLTVREKVQAYLECTNVIAFQSEAVGEHI